MNIARFSNLSNRNKPSNPCLHAAFYLGDVSKKWQNCIFM